ncbi:hypothetical protein [Burkholderia diffusa]|uniref:hypothetical protein n=1 Tax=Burkholderia diffusa TaxID=488732 RepID=UPI002ABD777C|nr:hypothetical protein [Burkholderia diffusa]
MSNPLEAATPDDEQNFLNRTFERVGERGLDVGAASRTLSQVHQGLIGISVISQILIANDVAKDSCGPALNDYLAGGLLGAMNALSTFMIDEIGDLADSADRRAKDAEVDHG